MSLSLLIDITKEACDILSVLIKEIYTTFTIESSKQKKDTSAFTIGNRTTLI